MQTKKLLALALTELRSGRTEESAVLLASVASASDLNLVISALSGKDIELIDSNVDAKTLASGIDQNMRLSMQSDPTLEHKFSLSSCDEEDDGLSLSPIEDLDLEEDVEDDSVDSEEEDEDDEDLISESINSPIRF